MSHPNLPNNQSAYFDLKKFQVQITHLSPGERLPLMVSIPPGLRVKDTPFGINTYRANAVVDGEIEFVRSGTAPIVKVAGESPQEARVAYSGEYWVKALNDAPATFACIVVKNPLSSFFNYETIVVAPGDSIQIPPSDKVSHLFLVQGGISISGLENSFNNFHHFEVSEGKSPVFENNVDVPAFLIRLIDIGVEGARALVMQHFPDNADDFAFITDHS